MRSIKGSFVGLVLSGILALAPAAAFAHGGGGGGHGGGGGGFGGGGGHFGGFAGHSFPGHGFTGQGFGEREGGHFARHGDHFRHQGDSFSGDPLFYDDPYGYDYSYDGYYDDDAGNYSGIIIAVQKELAQLGYYHGPVNGLIDPETEGAIRWFQSVDKLPVTGQIDDRTLKALGIS
jgi:Putative peptidoglycan binding domain